tara:strand:- start:378 stop:566 length:189 start_codon:yes stop_codon:yes gene_type:complete
MPKTTVVTQSDHNYDIGSLFLSDKELRIVGSTENGLQAWEVGGEIVIWKSSDKAIAGLRRNN